MRIKETLMSRTFSVTNPDPYLLSLRAMEEMSKDAKVVEKTNRYETDGPSHRSVVAFNTVEIIDDFSKIIFQFSLEGEGGKLRIGVNGVLDTKIEDTGFFSEHFTDYYVDTIFPVLRKISESRVHFFSDKIDEVFEKVRFRKAS